MIDVDWKATLLKVHTDYIKNQGKNKRVTNKIRSISDEVCKVIMANEPVDKWIEKVQDYIDNPVDTNHNRVEEVEAIACEHQVDD